MAVKNSQLADLIATTLEDLPKQEFEVMWDNAKYEFTRIYQNERMVIDGGVSIVRKVFLSPTGNARYRRPYDTDEPAVGDVMKTISVGWCQIGSNWSIDKWEMLQQKNSAKGFINLLKVRRLDGLWSLADLIEERAWKTPTNSTDDLYPNGVPYYINMIDADSTTGGFVGKTIRYQDGSTGTVCAGIDANTEDRWRNYADIYSKVDNSLRKTIRKAFLSTDVEAPPIVSDPASKRAATKKFYCNLDTLNELADLADALQDNHVGNELMGNIKVEGGTLVTINGAPVVRIKQLDGVTDPVTSDETDPIYYVDFTKFIPYVHDGYWMEEGEPMYDRKQHTTFTTFIDGAHQNLCLNRRAAGFVIHKAISS